YVGADGSLDAPIDTADQADAVAILLDALGIATLDAFIGYSYGALVGLQLAVRHPGRLSRLVAVSGAHRAHPYAAAWRALQRRTVRCAGGDRPRPGAGGGGGLPGFGRGALCGAHAGDRMAAAVRID